METWRCYVREAKPGERPPVNADRFMSFVQRHAAYPPRTIRPGSACDPRRGGTYRARQCPATSTNTRPRPPGPASTVVRKASMSRSRFMSRPCPNIDSRRRHPVTSGFRSESRRPPCTLRCRSGAAMRLAYASTPRKHASPRTDLIRMTHEFLCTTTPGSAPALVVRPRRQAALDHPVSLAIRERATDTWKTR